MELKDFWGLLGMPIVIALVHVTKPWVKDERAWPLIAIFWGVALNLLVAWALGNDFVLAGLLGLVVGLAASGLYDTGKAVSKTPNV